MLDIKTNHRLARSEGRRFRARFVFSWVFVSSRPSAGPQVRRSAGPGVDGHDGATRRREGVVRVGVRVRVRVVSLECVHTTRI
jgi:hypothetical protein